MADDCEPPEEYDAQAAGPGGKKHLSSHMAMVQQQWYHFGIGAPPILVYFSGDWAHWDVHWGYGVLTHGRMKSS